MQRFPINGKEGYFHAFGAKGFHEYQIIVPRQAWAETVDAVRSAVAETGACITLASLKLFKGQPQHLWFRGNGVCLTLDGPATRATEQLFSKLDRLAVDLGAPVNLSKDSRLERDAAAAIFPGYDQFRRDSNGTTQPGVSTANSGGGLGSETAIVVGASTGLGRALVEQLAAAGWHLVIASRTQSDLDAIAAELTDRYDVSVMPIAFDITGGDADLEAFISAASTAAAPAAVLITAGAVAVVDEGLDDWATTSDLISTNMTGVMKIAGHYASIFEDRRSGTLVLFSSIAAGAPRSKNVAYAAAKAGLESFARSMQHRLAGTGASVQLYRLGYVDTRLAQGQDLKLRPADPNRVAARVIDGLGRPSKTVFEPRYWGAIVRGLRLLPRFAYDKLKF